MRTIKVSKVYKTFEEFENSPELAQMWKGWQGKKTSVESKRRTYTKFFGCYVEAVNPESNYGRAFRLYNHYEISDGCRFLMEVSVTSCLSIHNCSPVFFNGYEISIGSPICSNDDRKKMIEICKMGVTLFNSSTPVTLPEL